MKKYLDVLKFGCKGKSASEVIDMLHENGMIDTMLLKVAVIRVWIATREKDGAKRVDAMFEAAAVFECTYEFVRKCIYYYKDIKLV